MEVSDQHHAPAALSPEKEPQHLLERGLGGSQNQSWHSNKEKKSQPLPEIKSPVIQPVA